MSGREKDAMDGQSPGGFISRWSRLKRAAASPPQVGAESPEASLPEEVSEQPLTDADMPPLESLDETSDYTGFLSEKVSESLRRQALRKLFHQAAFNVRDGLDDYDDDYTSFTKLGDVITADMRHQLAMAEERLKAAMESDQADPATAATEQRPPVPDQESEPEARAQTAMTHDDTHPRSTGVNDSISAANGQPGLTTDDGTAS
ncbi:DUF3306 domain-containing protein [Sedimenticola sp.]|uniref:DUF3306 domain-containing protein n=1 Tax=Sedimenticola sp. TaxID=1940285 RepID=UPI0025879699|nr:DUF3306 domain-containing protein [Sedimenticola sp.]MCW8902291.1 DUF3306 domain-containing protein [Sedimenticola sp.]